MEPDRVVRDLEPVVVLDEAVVKVKEEAGVRVPGVNVYALIAATASPINQALRVIRLPAQNAALR